MYKRIFVIISFLALSLTGCYTSFDAVDGNQEELSAAEANSNQAETAVADSAEPAQPAENYQDDENYTSPLYGESNVYNNYYYPATPVYSYVLIQNPYPYNPFWWWDYYYWGWYSPYYYYPPYWSVYWGPVYWGGYYDYYCWNPYYGNGYYPSQYKYRTNNYAYRNGNSGGRGYVRDDGFPDRNRNGRNPVDLTGLQAGTYEGGRPNRPALSGEGISAGKNGAGNEIVNNKRPVRTEIADISGLKNGGRIDEISDQQKKPESKSNYKKGSGNESRPVYKKPTGSHSIKPRPKVSRENFNIKNNGISTRKTSNRTYKNYISRNKNLNGNSKRKTYKSHNRSGSHSYQPRVKKYYPPKKSSKSSSSRKYTPSKKKSSSSRYLPRGRSSSSRSYSSGRSSSRKSSGGSSGSRYTPKSHSGSHSSYSPRSSSRSFGASSSRRSSGSSSRGGRSSGGRRR